METIVGVILSLMIIGSFSLMIRGRNQREYSREFHHLQGAGIAFLGLAGVLFGLLTCYLVKNSARPVVEGTVTKLRWPQSRGTWADFVVVTDSGQQTAVHCELGIGYFRNGERIRVHYIEYSHQLLEAKILAGPDRGLHLEESDGYSMPIFFALLGAVFVIGGYCEWNRTPRPAVLWM
jgi:hypothetical protein